MTTEQAWAAVLFYGLLLVMLLGTAKIVGAW
jgi:hypothetical protein